MNYQYCPLCAAPLAPVQFKPGEPPRTACPACEFVHYDQPSIAVGGIFRIDGEVALLRRAIEPGYGLWVFPGGYVDRGESLEEAVVRETREEVGIDVRVDRLLNVYSYRKRALIIAVYETTYVAGTLQALDEALAVETFALDALPWAELAFPSTRHALAEYILRRPVDAR